MATAPHESPDLDAGRIRLADVGWPGYRAMRRLLDDRGNPRLIYLDGDLTLVSPNVLEYERLSDRLGDAVKIIVESFQIPCIAAGRTTFRRRGRGAGIDGNVTFYLRENADRVRGKTQIDLRVDPPPDLAIEVVVTHPAAEALRAWRRLRVPEVWVADPAGITFLVRDPRGRFAPSDTSRAFPFLAPAELFEQVRGVLDSDDTIWRTRFRRWVQTVLASRCSGD